MAQPTCVERQNVCEGVSGMKTDSMEMAVGELQQELGGPVSRPLDVYDCRRLDQQLTWKRLPKLAPEVGHLSDIRHAAAMNPLEDLSAVKPRQADGGEVRFELVELELGRVDGNGCGHAAVL